MILDLGEEVLRLCRKGSTTLVLAELVGSSGGGSQLSGGTRLVDLLLLIMWCRKVLLGVREHKREAMQQICCST